ncbi:MAG: DUF420 domain-containing protein [Chitinophagales bacterium]
MQEKTINRLIFAVSVFVPVLVAVLFYTPAIHFNVDVQFLPKLNAMLNASVTVCLLAGYYFIRKKNRRVHKWFMMTAFSLSAIFLISYVVYHGASEPAHYGGPQLWKIVYLIILFTHIVLAAVILPFILFTFSRALTERFDKHRKIARITWPLWLYVAVSGVVVYLMISPYYGQ